MFLSFASFFSSKYFLFPLLHSALPALFVSDGGAQCVSAAIDFFPPSLSLPVERVHPHIFGRERLLAVVDASLDYISECLYHGHERARRRRRRRLPIYPTHNRTRQTDDGENKLTRLVSEHTINIDFFARPPFSVSPTTYVRTVL